LKLAMTETKGERTGADTLEGYEVLAKTAKGQTMVMIIQQVLKDPHLFVFGELVNHPNVLELEKTPSTRPWVETLRIFAYGTYKDYLNKKDELKLPDLPATQLEKLKQLSLVSHAAKHKILRYSTLMEELGLKDVRELEDVIIDTIYLGLVKGKLDQKKQVFEVEYAIGRDIGPDDVDHMLSSIQSWFSTSQELLKSIDKNIQSANLAIEQKKKEEEDNEKQRKTIIETIKAERESQGPELAAMQQMMGGPMMMDGRRSGGGGGGKRRFQDQRDPRGNWR